MFQKKEFCENYCKKKIFAKIIAKKKYEILYIFFKKRTNIYL